MYCNYRGKTQFKDMLDKMFRVKSQDIYSLLSNAGTYANIWH